MAKRQIIESALLEQYILGLTSETETREIEAYLDKNPSIAKEVRQNQKLMEGFAREFTAKAPRPHETNILHAVREDEQVIPQDISKTQISWFKGIAVSFALGFGLLAFLLFQQQANLENQLTKLEGTVQKLQKENELLNQQKEQINQQFAVLKDAKTNHVHLKGSELSPTSLIVVYWNEINQNAYLNLVNLPEIPANKSLQLWADVNGKMVNMGILNTLDKDITAIPFIPKAAAFNLTLEPKGGSEHPNIKQIYASGKRY